ncbi:MAG TPA: GGDEF domain-containing protein [Acidobacteriota bacterium]|nr:GGDEF domain-containing protein [Acidobacteriota bacterium]
MGWQRTTERLMEAIIRRDEKCAAEISVDLCAQEQTGGTWSFLRWDAEEGCLRTLWPVVEENPLPVSEDLRQRLEKGEPITDNVHSEGCNGDGAEGRGRPGSYWIPLVYADQLQGVLQGQAKDQEEEGFAPSGDLCRRIGLLARTWFLVGLLEEKERLLYLDPLTGLKNADYLIDFLKMELARSQRYQRSVAVAFLDIDWFKNVNDMHGHLMGSHVLRQVGRLLQSGVRESDVVVRYGGDEFVVVLPETSRDGAMQIAERLRSMVEEHEMQRDHGPKVRCTVSVGVSVFPQHGEDVSDLIHQADLAMYVAKHSNKNCVKLAAP